MAGSAIYSIGAVSRLIGVPIPTIRSWEERYALVVPKRSPGGHRLYTRRQVDQLRYVAEQVAAGLSPGDAHRLLAEVFEAGSDVLAAPSEGEGPLLVLLAERDPFAAEFAEYFLRTEGFETIVALDVADARAAFESRRPRVAVVDLLISGGEGLRLCADLAREDIPVIAVSSVAMRDEALPLVSVFLQKPLEPLVLVSAVKDLTGQSAYLRQRARRA